MSAGRASLWVPFAAVLAAGLIVAGPALAWPMAFDDLHLMRRFTRGQLLAAFHGQWDPERLMTRGLRPLTMLFNHARSALFGEDVRAHRVFVLVLHAGYWALLALVARRQAMAAATVAVAGVLWACAVPSVFHAVWITDGNHAVQGLSFVLATLALLQALETARAALSAGLQLASLAALLAGLLTREDTLATVPALLVLGYVRAAAQDRRRRFWIHALAVVLLCGAVLAYRARVVARVKPPRLDLPGMLQHALWTSNPLGTSWFDGLSAFLVVGWWVTLAVVALAFLARVHRSRWTGVCIWLLCAFLACTPGLTLSREDLLFFPATFFCLALAGTLDGLWSCPGWPRLVAALALAWGTLGGAYMSRIFAENFHPDSLRVIWWNGRYVYGAYSERAAIPPARRAAVVERLGRARIEDGESHLRWTRRLERRAVLAGHRRPNPDGRPFYPLLPWAED